MDDQLLNPLSTGALFVAAGQIMDPEIMRLQRHPSHLARLRADMGVDALAEPAPVAPRGWSLRRLLARFADLSPRRQPAPPIATCGATPAWEKGNA